MIDPDDALTLALNILRDSAESGRMPSGAPLDAGSRTVHQDAADRLERMRASYRTHPAPIREWPAPNTVLFREHGADAWQAIRSAGTDDDAINAVFQAAELLASSEKIAEVRYYGDLATPIKEWPARPETSAGGYAGKKGFLREL